MPQIPVLLLEISGNFFFQIFSIWDWLNLMRMWNPWIQRANYGTWGYLDFGFWDGSWNQSPADTKGWLYLLIIFRYSNVGWIYIFMIVISSLWIDPSIIIWWSFLSHVVALELKSFFIKYIYARSLLVSACIEYLFPSFYFVCF